MKRIKSIAIKNSQFFEDLRIDFSDKLNCIMGGRGTGKSTLLYFIKSCIEADSEDDSRIANLIQENLGNGEINLEIETEEGKFYRIIKTVNEEPQPYNYPNSEFSSIHRIHNEIKCDFYETGKIEQIGRSPEERIELIDKMVSDKLALYEEEIEDVQNSLDENAYDIKAINQRINRIHENLFQYESVEEEFKEHKTNQPIGIDDSEKDRFEIEDKNEKLRKNEMRYVNKSYDFLDEIETSITEIIGEVKEKKELNFDQNNEFLNKSIISSINNEINRVLDMILKSSNTLLQDINSLFNSIDDQNNELLKLHQKQQADFVKIKQKFEQHRVYINRYNLLSKRINEKTNLEKDLKEIEAKRKKLKHNRDVLIENLNRTKQNIFQIRLEAIELLNSKFEGSIKINLTPSGITNEFENELREALKGSGMRYNELIPRIVGSFSTTDFAKIVHNKDLNQLKTITGIDQSRSQAIIETLFESEYIYNIEKLYCNDLAEFKLKINEGGNTKDNYRRSDDLSMGQRCTAVLPIIFSVSTDPLIIDQPEDNLDNKYISGQIHAIIRKLKISRQLILITHNPNIPVLSESEHNIFLSYDKTSRIDEQGDVEHVKNQIVGLLEGGKDAFLHRYKTYGY